MVAARGFKFTPRQPDDEVLVMLGNLKQLISKQKIRRNNIYNVTFIGQVFVTDSAGRTLMDVMKLWYLCRRYLRKYLFICRCETAVAAAGTYLSTYLGTCSRYLPKYWQ